MTRPALALLVLALAAPAAGGAAVEPKTPIEHFIVLMQENHSFDNYFGTYPGADGIPEGTCMPRDPTEVNQTCVEPMHLGDRPVVDLDHNRETFLNQLRGGRMNGFVYASELAGKRHGALAMGYYDDRDLPMYWNVADEYVLFDRFFSSAGGGSVINHMYWVTGSPGSRNGDDAIPARGWGDLPTIFDRLDEAGISWKFYVQNYDPRITYRTRDLTDRGAQVVWVPLLAYARYIDDPRLASRIVDLNEYYDDLANGTLPAVSYMVPSGASEHPPGSIRAGQRFVRGLLNALMASDAWDTSAFLWTYDDWGGWYDHVRPPKVDRHGYGFRVPALLVSPYARKGHVDSTQLDFASVPKFIEENWGLRPLASRDRESRSMLSAFDFEQPPRKPHFLSTERNAVSLPPARRSVIYTAYSIAVAIPALLVSAAWISGRWSRRRKATT